MDIRKICVFPFASMATSQRVTWFRVQGVDMTVMQRESEECFGSFENKIEKRIRSAIRREIRRDGARLQGGQAFAEGSCAAGSVETC